MDYGWEHVLNIVFVAASACYVKLRQNNALPEEHESSYVLNKIYILFNVLLMCAYLFVTGRYIAVIHSVQSAGNEMREWMATNFENFCFVVSSALSAVLLLLSVYVGSYDLGLSTVLGTIGLAICFTTYFFALNTANLAIYTVFVWTMRVGSFLTTVAAMHMFAVDEDLQDGSICAMVMGMIALISGFVTPDPINGFSILPDVCVNRLIEWLESILNFENVNQLRREIMARERQANRERMFRIQALIRDIRAERDRARENRRRRLHLHGLPQYALPHVEGG